LDAGIDVLTTVNVQHVESLNDQIWQATGLRVRETVPDWIVNVADYLRADCLAVFVTKSPDSSHLAADERDNLQRHLNFARGLQIDTRILEGADAPETIVQFARLNGVTQIFLSREADARISARFRASLLERLVNLAHDMQVTIVADRFKRPNG
jgi:two-component system, OmpR family, sensor histidine kinase KdpD